MANQKLDPHKITFRPAAPEDAKVASRLLFDTFPKKATYVIGLGNAERAKNILRDLFAKPEHRLSYSVTEVALYEGRIVGLFTAFQGRHLGRLDRRLDWLILRKYSLRGKLAVLARGWPLVFIKEATRKEYFLSNLAVRKRLRGQGVGEIMLSRVEEKARQAEVETLSLMVHIQNERALKFYRQHGFKTAAIHLESNTRVSDLGAGYHRMIKELS